jgi:hypothetical protein
MSEREKRALGQEASPLLVVRDLAVSFDTFQVRFRRSAA